MPTDMLLAYQLLNPYFFPKSINYDYPFRTAHSNNKLPWKPVDATRTWVDLHDGDFQSAICMDLIYQAVDDAAWRLAYPDSNHLLHFHCSANISLAAAGLSDR